MSEYEYRISLVSEKEYDIEKKEHGGMFEMTSYKRIKMIIWKTTINHLLSHLLPKYLEQNQGYILQSLELIE